ncbi:hypothetical protein LDENG_00050160 [Lucifuga dentata]|nr:hypothetical protein LDENG_00050160 [Lucifuga dentata]
MSKSLIFGVIAFLMTGARSEVTEVFAESGSEAVLPCECKPPSPSAPFILWSKASTGTVWRKQRSGLQYWGSGWTKHGTQRIRSLQSELERGEYNLHITKVREEDAGVYTCRVEDGKLLVQRMVMLRVMKLSISPSVPVSGNSILISCNVTPWPETAAVRWTLNSIPFVPQTEIKLITSNRASVIKGKVTEKLMGNWTCVVRNKDQEGRATAPLSVGGIVHPSTDDTRVYVAVGSAVTLPCVFSPGLIPSDPLWEKLDAGSVSKSAPGLRPPSFVPSSFFSQHPWDKSTNLTEVVFEDEGRYRCSAMVGGQRLTRKMQLIVAKIDSNISSKKRSSVTLTCHLSDPREVTEYEWVHVTYDLNGTQFVRSIQKDKEKELTISKMSEENFGEWTCRFYGKFGILGNVTYQLHLSGLTGKSSAGLSHNTATVIGLSFLLLVLLLILAQMYKNHQRRKRIFQYPALETIVHTISNEREARERSRVKK